MRLLQPQLESLLQPDRPKVSHYQIIYVPEMFHWRSVLKLLSLFSDGLPQQWVKDISDDYGGVLPEFLKYIQFIHIYMVLTF